MAAVYIALGANLSNPKNTFSAAVQSLESVGCFEQARSALWQSPAWPAGRGQPDYINACLKINYQGSPRDLLTNLQKVEAQYGRVSGARNAARSLDLDILDFGGVVMRSKDLQLPHPRMLSRGFVLFPLAEIAPDWTDPVSGAAIEHWIARLPLVDVAPMRRLGPWRGISRSY